MVYVKAFRSMLGLKMCLGAGKTKKNPPAAHRDWDEQVHICQLFRGYVGREASEMCPRGVGYV